MNIRILRRRLPGLIVLLALATTCFVAGNVLTERATATAQAPTTGEFSALSAADELAVPTGAGTCTIENLAVFNNRIHVNCQPGVGGIPADIHFFAMPTLTSAESRLANRYLSLLMAAWAFGKQPEVAWLNSSSYNPGGCLVSDCRKIDYVVLR